MLGEKTEGGIIKGTREFFSELLQAAEVKREVDHLLAVKGYRIVPAEALGNRLWRLLTPGGWHGELYKSPGEAYRSAFSLVFGEKETQPLG